MEWQTPESQRRLWRAFLQYAQTHRAVLGTVPDFSCVILIPGMEPIMDHESLADLLQRARLTPETAVAYVYLDFVKCYLPFREASPCTIRDAWIEVIRPRTDALRSGSVSLRTVRNPLRYQPTPS